MKGNKLPADLFTIYNKCFACGKDNPIGLKLKFYQEGELAKAEFTPGELYQGWPGIVHGGILCTILDEAMGYAVIFNGIWSYVTARAEMRFRNQARIGEPLIITGSVDKKAKRLIWTSATIVRQDGTSIAESTAVMFKTGDKFFP